MSVCYYLVGEKNKAGEQSIRLVWKTHGQMCRSMIGLVCSDKYWNKKKQRAKSGFYSSQKLSDIRLNEQLDNLEKHLDAWTAGLRPLEKTSDSVMKEVIRRYLKGSDTSRESLHSVPEYFDRFIDEQSVIAAWAKSTRYKYGTVKRHLMEFNPELVFEDMTERFFNEYTIFLMSGKNMQAVSVTKEYKLLKAFLKWATKNKFNSRLDFLEYKYTSTVPHKPVIFLSSEELKRLREFEIPANGQTVTLRDRNGGEYTKTVREAHSLERVRDLFLFSSFTGLRYSDAQALNWRNIQGDVLRITIQKTQEEQVIDINPFAREILDKYRSRVPFDRCLPAYTNQKYNHYLKTLFELFGLDDTITLVETKNGQKVRNTYCRWELMTTHAARRTFVCFALAAGLSPAVVAKFTGHKSLASMKPYIEVSNNTRKAAMEQITESFRKL